MSNFVSLTSYFLIRTLQDDLRAMWIEERDLNHVLMSPQLGNVVHIVAMELYLDFLISNLAFFFFNGPLVTWIL